jgi:hypothetical protein
MKPRALLLLASLAALACLAACTGPYTITADVSSYGSWPGDREAGTYAFERLPSQALSRRQAELEYAARPALERAGFKAVTDPKSADVLVSLGAQVSVQDYPYWGDPYWWGWRGGYGYWRHGGYGRYGGFGYWPYAGYGYGYGPYGGWGPWGYGWADRRYEREVAVLVRDRRSNEPVFEAHASSNGMLAGDAALLSAMFQAALSDFPRPQPDNHEIKVLVVPAAPPVAPEPASAPASAL